MISRSYSSQLMQENEAADVIVAAEHVAPLDAGLSAALGIWTEELNDGEVANWHRHAVESHSLRNALRAILPLAVERMPASVVLDVRTIEAVRAAARTCERSGSVGADVVARLRALADEATALMVQHPLERRVRPERRQRRREPVSTENRRRHSAA